jgi:hypothetical protein
MHWTTVSGCGHVFWDFLELFVAEEEAKRWSCLIGTKQSWQRVDNEECSGHEHGDRDKTARGYMAEHLPNQQHGSYWGWRKIRRALGGRRRMSVGDKDECKHGEMLVVPVLLTDTSATNNILPACQRKIVKSLWLVYRVRRVFILFIGAEISVRENFPFPFLNFFFLSFSGNEERALEEEELLEVSASGGKPWCRQRVADVRAGENGVAL